ncbi:Caffeyl-CoA reductase-Etf complex subunit CarC [Carnimonas sp. R-84981]|uniref:acyl-CoA dehydrogenase family protein n=1 Tax=Carnimonas bestiolae TaxID=3402172 RepID=UPI003EDC8190
MIRDNETHQLLLSTVRAFVRDVLRPHEKEVEENNEVPESVVAQMRDLGLFGLTIPEEYGGLGLTMEEEAEVCFELGRTSPAFRSLIGTNNGIGSQGILIDGTEEQKSFYLPKLATGEYLSSFCLTEPDAGSDAGSLKTIAERDGDDYLISGTKRFITNAPYADIFTVMARTDRDAPGAKGISAFIVERKSDGVTIGKPDHKMGQKGSLTADVIFDKVRVPAKQLIGGVENVGFKTAMKVLDKGRLHMAAFAAGVSDRMLEDTLLYAIERKQFGRPIASFELIQGMLADSKAELYAAKSMVLDAARKRDEGQRISTEASCAKMFSTEACGRIADRCVQIYGGAGYVSDYDIERFYRDVRLFRIYEGTTQIQQLVIAKNMVKEVS